MVSADQFLQCDVRLRQAKLNPQARFGGLAMNLCGDFLQSPPVDKHGTRKSLALLVDAVGDIEIEEELPYTMQNESDVTKNTGRKTQPA